MMWRKVVKVTLSLLLMVGLGFFILGMEEAPAPKFGGTLTVAITERIPNLDWQSNYTYATRLIGMHVYEGLVVYDRQFKPIPQLAKSWQISEDGLTYTFHLRQGVLFHNGKEMTAEDVKASLERFIQGSPRGGDFKAVKEIVVVDPYTIEIRLSKKVGTFIPLLANPLAYPAIMPKEIAEIPVGKLETNEIIGTGPFKVAEWKPAQYLKLERFKNYVADDSYDGPSGFGGKRTAYLDEVLFKPVPESASRVGGLKTGEFDFTDVLPLSAYESLKKTPKVIVQPTKLPVDWITLLFNPTKPPFNDVVMRRAVQATLDEDEVMSTVAEGRKEFYQVDSSWMFKGSRWYDPVGEQLGLYNQKNPEKAKRLMEEAGYKGESITMITTSDYDWMYKAALVTYEQLKNVGFNVHLEVYDWPGMLSVRADRDAWDISYTGMSWKFDPVELNFLIYSPLDYVGYKNPEIDRLIEEEKEVTEFEERYRIRHKIWELVYRDVPAIKHGDIFSLRGYRDYVKGYEDWYGLRFWNVWLAKE